MKVIINAAITGMVPTREMTPHVPLTPGEIGADASRCQDAGAAVVHIHARNRAGVPTTSMRVWTEVLQAVREAAPGLLVSASCSGRQVAEVERRAACLDATPRPDLGSLTLGSMNFPQQASVNAPDTIRGLAARMRERGITPELEIFEVGMAEYAGYLVKKGVLAAPLYANILLGNLGTLGATQANLDRVVAALPAGTTWSVAGIGRYQREANRLGLAGGGHARVGLEDNIWMDDARAELATNAGLVERVAGWAEAYGRGVASPGEARDIIGLPLRP